MLLTLLRPPAWPVKTKSTAPGSHSSSVELSSYGLIIAPYIYSPQIPEAGSETAVVRVLTVLVVSGESPANIFRVRPGDFTCLLLVLEMPFGVHPF